MSTTKNYYLDFYPDFSGQPPAEQSSVTDTTGNRDFTWTFDSTPQVGQYLTGGWWVVGPVNVIDITPAPRDGVYNGGMGRINKSAINPIWGDNQSTGPQQPNNQPFDETQWYRPEDSIDSTDWPIALTAGDSLVSSKSWDLTLDAGDGAMRTTVGGNGKLKNWLDACAVLTCVSAPPPPNSFRPQPGAGTKRNFSLADLRPVGDLPNYARTPSCPATVADVGSYGSLWFEWCNVQPGDNSTHYAQWEYYGADKSAKIGKGLLRCCMDYGGTEKSALYYHMVQHGIDFFGQWDWIAGVYDRKGWGTNKGGIGGARKAALLFAGWALNDSAMLNLMSDPRYHRAQFSEDTHTYELVPGLDGCNHGGSFDPITNPPPPDYLGEQYWFQHRSLGNAPGYGTNYTIRNFQYGDAAWSDHGGPDEDGFGSGVTMNTCSPGDTDYLWIDSSTWSAQALTMHMLGLQAEFGHEWFFKWVDQWHHMQDHHANSGWRDRSAEAREMWDAHRPGLSNATYPYPLPGLG